MSEAFNWKEAGVFLEDGDALHLVMVTLGSIFTFFVLFEASERAMNVIPYLWSADGGAFAKMSSKVKMEYYSRIVSSLHAMAAIYLAVISCYYVCDNPTKSIFTSDEHCTWLLR